MIALVFILLSYGGSRAEAQQGAELLVYPERLVSVVAGSAGSLTCVAYGNPQPEILWLKDGVPLQNESSLTIYNTYLEDANMSFVQSILEVCTFFPDQQGNYSCYTENNQGNNSFPFQITVIYDMVMLHEFPSNRVVDIADEVMLACTASSTPSPSISWYKDGSLLDSNVSNITTTMLNNDTLTSVLYLTDLRLADAGLYSCNASDSVGGIDAREFTLTIQSGVELLIFPTNSTAVVGSSSSFTCAVAGIPLPQIVWRRNGNFSMDMYKLTTESNFTNSSSHFSVSILTLCDVRLSDSSVYTCTASNNVSQAEASFTFNIYSPPTVQPISDLVIGEVKRNDEYSNVSIKYSVEAVPLPHVIEWTYAPNNLADAEPINRTRIFDKLQFSMDNMSVTLENVSLSDAGIFTLTATNEVGTANASVRLIVYAEPTLIDTGYSGNNYTENETMWFWCSAEGVPDPRIVWLHNELWVPELSPRHEVYDTLINGTVNSTLTVNNVQLRDAGKYLCRVDPFNISIGRSVISEIFLVNVYPERIDYCQSQPCLNNGTCYNTTNGYNCSCRSGYKGINCQMKFTVYEAAVIVRNPNFSESPSLFATISVTCNVQGSPPPIITWYKDGKELPGQHDQTLVLEEVTLESRGRYHCNATNSDPNNQGIQSMEMSDVTILNIEGVVQYKAEITLDSISGNRTERQITEMSTEMIINEMASRLSGVEFPEYNATVYSVTGDPPSQPNATINTGDSVKPSVDIIITLLAPEGNARLKNAVLKRLQEIAPEVSHQVSQELNQTTNQDIVLRNISRFDGCEAEDTILEPLEPGGLSITLSWPESDLGEKRLLQCPCGNLSAVPGRDDISNAMANRVCGGDFINGGKWRAPFASPCNFSSTTRQLCRTFALINGQPEEAITVLDNITRDTDNIGSTEIGVTTYILEALQTNVVASNQSQNLTRGFLTVVDNLLDVKPEEIQMSQEASNSSARILAVVERVSESIPLPENKSQVIIPLTSFAVAVTQVDLSQQFFGQIISTSLGGDSNNRNELIDLNEINITRITNDSESAQAGQRTSLAIPRNVFERLGNSSSSGRITNSIFLNDVLFSRRNSSASAGLEVGGIIIAATLSNNVTVQKLNPPVRLTFQKNPSLENGTNTTCRFWDFLADGGFGDWSSRGCILISDTETIATCECDHLTNFAILLDPNPVIPMKDQTMLFLSVLSYIGAIVSIICLMVTIVMYLTSKKLRSSEAGQLLVNLCVALLGLYILYITSLHATRSKPVCAVAGGLLHYFMLASFLAMGAEAISLYTKLVMVLGVPPIIKNRYVLKACLIVWILPFIVVVLSEAPNWKNYVMEYYCRPYGPAFYGGLMVPFLIIYIFNWVIFVSIFVSLLRKKALTGNSGTTTRLKQNFIIAVTLSLLFGLGWGVGLTATSQIPIKGLSYFLQTVFVLLTGFQGLLIFIMHCVRSEECRNQWKKWLYIASLHKIHLYMKASTLTGQVTSDYGKGTSGKNTYTSYTLTTQSQTLQRVLKKEMDSGIAPSHSDTLSDHKNAFTPTQDPSGEEKKVDLSSDNALQIKEPANPFLVNGSDDAMVVVNPNAMKEEVEMDVTNREDGTQHTNTAGEFVPGEEESIISEFDTVWLPSSSKTSCSSLQSQPNEKRLSRQSGLADLVPNTRTSQTQLPGNIRTSLSQLSGNTRTSQTQLPGKIRTSLSQLSGNTRTSQTQLPGNSPSTAACIEKAPLIEEQESSEADDTSIEN